MNKYIKQLYVASAVAVALSIPMQVSAQQAPKKKAALPPSPIQCAGHEKRKTSIPGQKVGKKVTEALEFYNADNVDEAINVLKSIKADGFDKAFAHNFLARVLAGAGKYDESLKYLKRAVNSKVLNDREQVDGIKLIADLNIQDGKYRESIKWYKEWLKVTCKDDYDVYFRMANAHYQLEEWANIIEPINKAIQFAEKPNKTAFALKMTSYFNRKMYKEAIEVQEVALKAFPEDKGMWSQLGMLYMTVEDHRKALSTFEIAYGQGYITKPAELRALSQLYTMNDVPYKAATVLEKHVSAGDVPKDVKTLSSIAGSYHQALEFRKAAEYYGKAADLESDPDLYYKQGRMLYSAERPNEAIKALQKSLDEGFDKPGTVHLLIMEAHFYKGRYKQAYYHLQQAKKDKSTSRRARSWESYVKEKAKNNGVAL